MDSNKLELIIQFINSEIRKSGLNHFFFYLSICVQRIPALYVAVAEFLARLRAYRTMEGLNERRQRQLFKLLHLCRIRRIRILFNPKASLLRFPVACRQHRHTIFSHLRQI